MVQFGRERIVLVIDAIRHYLTTHPDKNLIQQFDEVFKQKTDEVKHLADKIIVHHNLAPEVIEKADLIDNPFGSQQAQILGMVCYEVLEPFGEVEWVDPIIELIAGQRQPEEVKKMVIQIN